MVSYLPERTSLPLWMTVKQLQDFYEDFYADFQRERSEEMLDRLEISAKQRMKHMSKGTREKVQLILAIAARPSSTCWMSPSAGWTRRPGTIFWTLSSATTTLRPR